MISNLYHALPVMFALYCLIGGVFYCAARIDQRPILRSLYNAVLWPLTWDL